MGFIFLEGETGEGECESRDAENIERESQIAPGEFHAKGREKK